MNPFIECIVPFITKEERYNLFSKVDELLEGNYIEKAKALGVEQSAYYQYKKKEPLFCWDNIPGSDNQKLKEFLKKEDWVKRAKIDKVDDKTVRVSKKTKGKVNFILLELNDEKSKVTVKFDGKTDELAVENEDGKLNVYGKNLGISDDRTLILLQLLHDKDPKQFNEFLSPKIVPRAKHQILILSYWLNFGLDFNLAQKLQGMYQRYEEKKHKET